tara:strand:- start:229 stop:789 length:561 start_codon:yes stop_codon:yes gene_type:complete
MAWKYNNSIIRAGKSWTNSNGATHPKNWASVWDDERKAAHGLVWEDDPTPFDNRFYWGRQDDSTLIPKSLTDVNEVDEAGNPILDTDGVQLVTKGLKSNAIATVKQQAAGLLAPSDWYVVRKSEVDKAIPSDISTYRAAVRTASGTIEAAISGVTTLDAFIALYDAPVDADGNVTGNAPINDWPEA